MNRLSIFIAFHGRFPSEKAAALFVAENARSLSKENDVTLLLPRRRNRTGEAHAVYGLHRAIRTVYFPIIDLFWLFKRSRIPFYLSLWLYSVQIALYALVQGRRTDIFICNDLLVALVASVSKMRVVYEVHDYPERGKWLVGWILSRIDVIIATNAWKRDALARDFPASATTIILERNGVDIEAFSTPKEKYKARAELALSNDKPIALYTGHLYSWKGVDTFAAAAELIPDVRCICVGGTAQDVERYRAEYGHVSNLTFVGHVAHQLVPLWQAAADVLVLPNTAREEISQHYTSPMKLFEYMASGRPIVASRIPSISELLAEETGILFEPDNAEALARAITTVLKDPHVAEAKALIAQQRVAEYSWDRRAARLKQVFVGCIKRS